MCSTSHALELQVGDLSDDLGSLPQAAASLISLGNEIFSSGGLADAAMAIFDAAHSIIKAPSTAHIWGFVAKNLQVGSKLLIDQASTAAMKSPSSDQAPPDLYEEDECDVGPRILKTPVDVDTDAFQNMAVLEAVILFNKGLVYHSKGNVSDAKQLYQAVIYTVQHNIVYTVGAPSNTLLELGLRSHNNFGLISYLEHNEKIAVASFEASREFAQRLAPLTKAYRLEYATTLSNWCRVNWMRGDISDYLYKALKEVLRLRNSILPWDHPDVAAARYNVAVAEYARQDGQKATSHLLQYLAVSFHRSKEQRLEDVDAIPALIFLLLIQNEDKDDDTSQELVRGLRTLMDKRHDEGPDSVELASVLNFVGTLLFHKKDFEHALIFFREELRLEENNDGLLEVCSFASRTTPVNVTCNNIGRILQELGRFHEAIYFYERALNAENSNATELTAETLKNSSFRTAALNSKACSTVDEPFDDFSSSINLKSTIWYNLGLIHDKLESYDEAIVAFEMSLELRRAMLGPDHPDIACLLYNIGVLQMEEQRLNDASSSFREVLRIRRIGAAGQLNDSHLVKTLQKLASLHQAKGDISRAIEASREVLAIQESSEELTMIARAKDLGITLRSVSELYHAYGDLQSAARMAIDSINKLSITTELHIQRERANVDIALGDVLKLEHIANVEQLVSSLLLLGSLYHEMSEPLQAEKVLREAATIVVHAYASADKCHPSVRPSSFVALREVTCMLATVQCAPVA